jgi:hypothetical protein
MVVMKNSEFGVYFSANDVVYDWTIAFLNSFRKFNPNLRLILIPFNKHCDRLLQLQSKYNFEVFIDPSFDRLEAIGQAFELGHTPTGPYWFRRYSPFWGPCDRFLYLDARQVVLSDLTPLISALDEFDFEFLHYDCAIDQVYQQGEFRQELLRQGKGRGFLSGLWAARKGLFSIEEFELLAADALKLREQLNPRNTDQAFINYCCDIKALRYGHFAEVLGSICENAWARQSGTVYQSDGIYRLWDYGGQDHKKQVVLMHWAGHKLRSTMPNHHLFDRYFSKEMSLLDVAIFRMKNIYDYLSLSTISAVRENRIINILYHQLKAK